jgi:hypothetical protein
MSRHPLRFSFIVLQRWALACRCACSLLSGSPLSAFDDLSVSFSASRALRFLV